MNIRTSTSISGKLAERLEKLRREKMRKTASGNHEAAKILLEASNEIVPVETGSLQRSGRAGLVGTGWDQTAFVGYGNVLHTETHVLNGKTVVRNPHEYAVYVHEDPANPPAVQKDHAPPTQSKFLQTARMTHLDAMRKALEAEVTK